jgi:thiol:disulfide interchange protein DsbD
VPEPLREGELLTYGYGHAHTLLYEITLPEALAGTELRLEARADWLVCKDICIPGWAELEQTVRLGPPSPQINADVFRAARKALPQGQLSVLGKMQLADGELRLQLPPSVERRPQDLLPAQQYLVNHAAGPRWSERAPWRLNWPLLDQSAQAPRRLQALLIEKDAARWVVFEPAVLEPMAAGPANSAAFSLGIGMAVLLAFGGGVLLNLMPCVFPVLALKAMGLARGENLAQKRREAGIYTLGVLLSFVTLAALLLGLRAGGAALGWGFQLQNPAVVAALGVLMAYLGLAMLGWTQVGSRWMGMGQSLTEGHGPRQAFFTGVLAVVVASPCTAPFMGAALGYAVTQPALVALVIFASLGLGLAAPILLLALVPMLARRLPRPGPWMDKAKHILALPLFATAAWLFWVVAGQAGTLALLAALASFLLLALVSRMQGADFWLSSPALRRSGWLVALLLLAAPLAMPPADQRLDGDWQSWSKERVTQLQAQGQPVFVDFTADWCISCLVNERTALADKAVQAAFAEQDVVLLKADWTRQDPAITAALAEFDRNGVPLYLLYDRQGQVQVLPQILTPGTVLKALRKL